LGDSLSKSGFDSNDLDRHENSHPPRPKSPAKITARQPDLPHPGNGRDGKTINRGQMPTKTAIVAMRNDGMNNQFRDRCRAFHFEESRVASHFNKTRNANRSESTVSRSVSDLHPLKAPCQIAFSHARQIKSRVYPRSLDRGQAARFPEGDVIAASPVALLGVLTFLFFSLS
jgi:hypothetical protein